MNVSSHPVADHIGQEGTSFKASWYLLAILTAIYTVHVIDRYVISVVLEPIKAEFRLSDASLGVLGGLAHSVAMGIAALPMGWLVDRCNRRKLLTACVAVWSMLTCMAGVTTSYAAMLLTRVGVGAAEAASSPACLSLIADNFPPRLRSTATGVFYASTAIGTGTIFLLGGHIAEAYGWRSVFLFAGVPGLALAALLFFTTRDRQRGDTSGSTIARSAEATKPPTLRETAAVVAQRPVIIYIALASTFKAMATGAVLVWLATFLIRIHGYSLANAGLITALGLGVAQSIGSVVLGRVGDAVSRGSVSRLAWLPMISCTLICPVLLGVCAATSGPVAVALSLVLGFLIGGTLGPAYSMALSSVPPLMRGSIIALIHLVINVFGTGVGATVTGIVSDFVGGDHSLRTALGINALFYLLAALFFYLSSRAAARSELAGIAPTD